MGNSMFVWSIGTGYGWVLGHLSFKAFSGLTESTICERWSLVGKREGSSAVSVSGFIGLLPATTARQSGNMMRTTNLPLSHRDGGFVENVPVFMHLHWTFLPCTVTIFSPAGWASTGML